MSLPSATCLPSRARCCRKLRALLDRMRRAADRIDQRGEDPIAELRTISAELNALLLSHQLAEERAVFPELAHRLGGRDPLSSMARMHEEIAHLATRFTALVRIRLVVPY